MRLKYVAGALGIVAITLIVGGSVTPFCGLSLFFGATFLIWAWTQRARGVPGLRTPPTTFFLGNLPEVWRTYEWTHDESVKHARAFGPGAFTTSFPFRGGSADLWLPINEKCSKYIHKDNWKNYQKGVILQEVMEEFLGKGIFTVDGDAWRKQRKTASHMFSARALKEDMAPVFVKHAETFLRVLKEHAVSGEPIDLHDMFFRYSITAFAEIGFGVDLGAITKPASEVPFIAAFDTAQQCMSQRMISPAWWVMRFLQRSLGRFFTFSDRERKIIESIKVVNAFAKKVIEERKQEFKEGRKKNMDLVSRFLQGAVATDEQLSDSYLKDIVLNFLIAGRDTTACVLSWLFYELMLNPKEEQKLVEEARTVIEKYRGKEPAEMARHLVRIEAAIMETLRLHPSVPFEFKTSMKDDVLPDGTKVPGNSMVIYSPYVWGRSEVLWGKDATVFRVDRWFESENVEKDEYDGDKMDKDNVGPSQRFSQYKFNAFNAGPRLCLGKHVALLEAKILAAAILNSCVLELVPGQKITYLVTITLQMKNGMKVTVKPRGA